DRRKQTPAAPEQLQRLQQPPLEQLIRLEPVQLRKGLSQVLRRLRRNPRPRRPPRQVRLHPRPLRRPPSHPAPPGQQQVTRATVPAVPPIAAFEQSVLLLGSRQLHAR